MNWVKADKCKSCGRIYNHGREICKCGMVLRKKDLFLSIFTNYCIVPTDNCESIIAKIRFFKWIER